MDSETREAIDQLAGMIAREFARVNTRLDAGFASVDARFISVETRFEARFVSVEARLDRFEARFISVEGRLDRVERRLDNLDSNLRDFRREVKLEFASVRQSIDALTARVEVLELGA